MSSTYDTALGGTATTYGTVPAASNSWFFRDQNATEPANGTFPASVSAVATAGAVNGTYTGGFWQHVVSPLARDTTTAGPHNAPIAGVHLDGASGYVALGNNFNFSGTNPVFSLALLVRRNADFTPGVASMVFDKSQLDAQGTPQMQGWHLAWDNLHRLSFHIWTGGATGATVENAAYTGSLTPGIWYHYVLTCDGTNLLAYLDGQLVNSVAITGTAAVNATSATCCLGYSTGQGNTGYFYNGEIGPVAVWSGTALSQPNVTTLYQAAFQATGTSTYTLGVAPTTTLYAACTVLMAGDTLTVPYNSGTPWVEIQARSSNGSTAINSPGTKLSPIRIISDQPAPYTLKPIIQFGDGTHDLRDVYKFVIMEQGYINITGIAWTQFQFGTGFNDRIVGFWTQQYGFPLPEQQSLSVTAGATGTFSITFPGNSAAAGVSVTASAATVQAALRGTTSTTASGAGCLTNITCTGGPLGTAAVICTFDNTGPYSSGPMALMTVTQPATGTANAPTRTQTGGNGSRVFQSADFCKLSYCTVSNGYEPFKCSRAVQPIIEYTTITGSNVGMGYFNVNGGIVRYNTFLQNRTDVQDTAIQPKGGCRNCQIYGNVIRIPTGSVTMNIGVGGSSNAPDGLFDWSQSGYELYNSVIHSNVIVSELNGGFTLGAVFLQAASNCLVDHNIILRAVNAIACDLSQTWPQWNVARPCDAPTITNNVIYGYNSGDTDFKYWNAQATDVPNNNLVYAHNHRYNVATRFTQATSPSGDTTDPQFLTVNSDWRIRTSSPLRRQGTLASATAYGSAFGAGAIDVAHDFIGRGILHATSDLGVYATPTVPRLRGTR